MMERVIPAAVHDNKERSRFEMEIDGSIAFANYREAGSTVVIIHTEVPPALNGRGIGSALVKGALDIIRASGKKVLPRCDFAAAYIERHPEYRDLLA